MPRDRLVNLGYLAIPEQGLVSASVPALRDEHQQPGGDPVQPVRRRQIRQVQIAPQPDKRGLQHVLPARDSGQEVRFVHYDKVLVAMHHADLERHRHLVRQVPVEPDERARLERRVGGHRPGNADDPLLREHLVQAARRQARDALDEVVADGRSRALGRKLHPGRAQPVARW